MKNQKLEETIESLKHDQCQQISSTTKKLRIVLKVFATYSNTTDTLPPPTLIPICLFVIPDIFRKLLGLQEGQELSQQPQKQSIKLCLQLYLKGLLRLITQCQQQIRHVVIQSMSKSILFTPAFPILAKKWVKSIVEVWANSNENLNLGLRCFMALERLLKRSDSQFYMWALRRIYVGYFEHSGQLSWRTIEHINFMSNCLCQLSKIMPDRAYYVLFGYLRSLAMQVNSLNNLKGKQKSQISAKLYSQQTLQILRLYSQIVCKVGEEEISALTFPLVEVINAYEHITQSPQYIPLKLHLIQMQLQIMEQTGLYIPHALQTMMKILRSSPFQKKHSRKAGVEGSIELGYHLSQIQLKNTNFINDIFNRSVYYIYWFYDISSKMLAGPQITKHLVKQISNLQFAYSGYKKQLKTIIRLLKTDAEKINQIRRKKKLALNEKAVDKFQTFLSSDKIELEGRQKYKQLFEEHQKLIKAKIMAEHEDNNEEDNDNQEPEDDQQLQSGWQQASQGASQFQDNEQQLEQKNDELESVSYEGDPEDASQAAKQWSEHEWSSQQQADG